MKIKKFTAPTLQEGKLLIKKELGEEAVVLSTRTVRNKETGNNMIEIVAAVDDTAKRALAGRLRAGTATRLGMKSAAEEESSKKMLENTSQIFEEIAALKDMIGDVSDYVKYRFSGSLGPVFGKVFSELIKADISEDYAQEIIGRLSAEKLGYDFDSAYKRARKILTENIDILPPVKKFDKRKIAAFIGPTGSGKTTTLVKLAIVLKLIIEADVMLVSADIHKVGGIDQLQSYASIAGIPFKAAYTPEEVGVLINSEQQRDFILIDTTGRPHNNKEQLKEIGEMLDSAECDFLYLVESSTSGLSTLKESIKNYKTLKPNALILTKIDETASMGNVIEALRKESLPIAYFTNGQKIPDDIEPATTDFLGEIVLPKLNSDG